MKRVWIASCPRSGNTFLRQCFDLETGSVYPDDLGGNRDLERIVGHVDHRRRGRIGRLLGQRMILTKTHEPERDDAPAICILRDARAAMVSLWEFLGRRVKRVAIPDRSKIVAIDGRWVRPKSD